MRRLVDLDKGRRDVVFSLAYDYGSLLSDVIDILEIFDWDSRKAEAALAGGVSLEEVRQHSREFSESE